MAAAALVTSAAGARPRAQAASCGADARHVSKVRQEKHHGHPGEGRDEELAREIQAEGNAKEDEYARLPLRLRRTEILKQEQIRNGPERHVPDVDDRDPRVDDEEPVERDGGGSDERREAVTEQLPAGKIRDPDQQRAAHGVEDAVAAGLAAEERHAGADRELGERRMRVHEFLPRR